VPPEEQDYIFIFTLAGEVVVFVHDILKSEIRRDLIPIDRIEKHKIGNQKQQSADGVYKKYDHSGVVVDSIRKYMKNNRRAHNDIDDDKQGVKNGDYGAWHIVFVVALKQFVLLLIILYFQMFVSQLSGDASSGSAGEKAYLEKIRLINIFNGFRFL